MLTSDLDLSQFDEILKIVNKILRIPYPNIIVLRRNFISLWKYKTKKLYNLIIFLYIEYEDDAVTPISVWLHIKLTE
jgi:hypothetical protein